MSTPALQSPRLADDDGYRPFQDEGRRNATQEFVEIPAMLLALGVPRVDAFWK